MIGSQKQIEWTENKTYSVKGYHNVRMILVLDYEQSLFPLRDSRGKRTSERARNRLPRWNVTRVSSRWFSETSRAIFAPARLFVSLDYPWAERETARSLYLFCALNVSRYYWILVSVGPFVVDPLACGSWIYNTLTMLWRNLWSIRGTDA